MIKTHANAEAMWMQQTDVEDHFAYVQGHQVNLPRYSNLGKHRGETRITWQWILIHFLH